MNDKAKFDDYAFIGLGANLPSEAGDPVATLRAAIPQLQRLSDSKLLLSSFYESDPKDCPPGSPRYVNAVAGLKPREHETPESLLKKLQDIELARGRVRTGTINEARTLDLDLLSYRDESRHSACLTLPHPRAHERRFVLQPWIELAGANRLLAGKRLGEWLARNRDPLLTKLK